MNAGCDNIHGRRNTPSRDPCMRSEPTRASEFAGNNAADMPAKRRALSLHDFPELCRRRDMTDGQLPRRLHRSPDPALHGAMNSSKNLAPRPIVHVRLSVGVQMKDPVRHNFLRLQINTHAPDLSPLALNVGASKMKMDASLPSFLENELLFEHERRETRQFRQDLLVAASSR